MTEYIQTTPSAAWEVAGAILVGTTGTLCRVLTYKPSA